MVQAASIGRAHPLRGGRIPLGSQSRAGGTGAHCAPLWGGSHSPPCLGGGWVAAVWRDNAFTREARLEGERVIHKRERTLVLSLLCAVRPRTPAAAGVQRATAAQRRLLASRRPRSRPRCAGTSARLSKRKLMEWRAEVVAPYGAVSHVQGRRQGGWCRWRRWSRAACIYAHLPVTISPNIEQYSRQRTATHCPGWGVGAGMPQESSPPRRMSTRARARW